MENRQNESRISNRKSFRKRKAGEQDDAIIGTAFKISSVVLTALIIIGGVAAVLPSRPEPIPPTQESTLSEVAVREIADIEPLRWVAFVVT
ncbi:MAG: hypothetical protein R3C05_15715 [Pirellulaceae bacterium]